MGVRGAVGVLLVAAVVAGGPVRAGAGSVVDEKSGVEYVAVPAGSYDMGGEAWDEKPVHKVDVPRLLAGRTEVTVGQFRRFVEATGHVTDAEKEGNCWTYDPQGFWKDVRKKSWRDTGFAQADDHPVVCVSYDDATAFCAWAGCRLPTEEEWEYLAGNGARHTPWAWGDAPPAGVNAGNIADDSARRAHPTLPPAALKFDDTFIYTAPGGKFAANDFGLVDMTGNVIEWTSSWYAEDYMNGPAKEGSLKVQRGGSWRHSLEGSRSYRRVANEPTYRNAGLGFRVVRDAQ